MTSSTPGLLNLPRLTTLIASLLVALSSGTNYVYSAYSPQLGARLRITHTQLNVIALAGNVGVYSSGPFWGRIVDARGPRILLSGAFIFLLAGYSGIRHLFDAGLQPNMITLPTLSYYALVLCSFLTGAGGNGGLTSSVNSTAKSFPDRLRATTTGIVLSGFGLSAFFFSTIAHAMFSGDTSAFLLVLSLGTSFPMIMGFFLVRPIPLPQSESGNSLEHGIVEATFDEAAIVDASSVIFEHGNSSHAPLLAHDVLDQSHPNPLIESFVPNIHNSMELGPSRSPSPNSHPHRARSRSTVGQRSLSQAAKLLADGLPNIYGKRLWVNSDFWLLFLILSLLSGTGLMYINNVGSMSQALYASGNPSYDEAEALRWQATQVSSISILNFLGRIFIGVTADFAKSRLHVPRSYCLTLVAFFFFISQITAARIDNISNLWVASALLGLAHGCVFGFFPMICIEWFGLPHFSENWGYLSASPMFGGNLFSMAFGRNLDAHEPPESQSLSSSLNLLGAAHQCLEGRECYVKTLHLTTAACFLGLCLSVWAGWRDRRRMAIAAQSRAPRIGVVWEDPEE